MNKNWAIFMVLALAVLVGVYFIFSSQKSAMPENMGEATLGNITGGSTSGETAAPKLVSGSVEVDIKGFAFVGQTTRVSAGTKIIWKNFDDARHSVVSDTGLFASKVLAKGETFTYVFRKEGSFTYHCGIHPNMKGEIFVTKESPN